MLLLPGNSSVAQRVQGAFVAEEEIRKVVAHWRRQAPEVVYVSGVEGDDDDAVTSSANAFSGRRRRRCDDVAPGDGARRAQPARVHVDAPAQAEGRLRPGRTADGPARAARRRRPERGLEGPRRADDRRGVRAAPASRARATAVLAARCCAWRNDQLQVRDGGAGSLAGRVVALLRRDVGVPEEPGRLGQAGRHAARRRDGADRRARSGRPDRRQHVRLHRRRPAREHRHRARPRRSAAGRRPPRRHRVHGRALRRRARRRAARGRSGGRLRGADAEADPGRATHRFRGSTCSTCRGRRRRARGRT